MTVVGLDWKVQEGRGGQEGPPGQEGPVGPPPVHDVEVTVSVVLAE
jgi:hypothetical protein